MMTNFAIYPITNNRLRLPDGGENRSHLRDCHPQVGVVRTASTGQDKMPFTTFPWTSVRRKSRPWNLYVSFSWLMPSR